MENNYKNVYYLNGPYRNKMSIEKNSFVFKKKSEAEFYLKRLLNGKTFVAATSNNIFR